MVAYLSETLEAIRLWSGWGQDRPNRLRARIQNAISNESASTPKTLETRKLGGTTFVVSSLGDADYSTINGALAVASDGDRVVIKPGTYREDASIEKPETIELDRSEVVLRGGLARLQPIACDD